ncbi:unnamed protein product [Schistosoma turkestanicum]|nr:unnamed protein product [Schistosoma turkestanicum]
MNNVLNEIAVMNTLKHPRLIQLYDAYQIDEEVTLVLELKRMTASECLQHQWLKQKKKMPKRSGTVSKKRLKHFVYRRKWQKAVNAIIALQRMGVVLQHSPNMPTRHSSINNIHHRNRSFEKNDTKRPKLPQVTEHKYNLSNSPPTPPPPPPQAPSRSSTTTTAKKENSPTIQLMKKPSGIFRKTSFFGKTRKDDNNNNSTTENLSNPTSPNKNKLDLPNNTLKRKESTKMFRFQRHKTSQQSTSSENSGSLIIIPKIDVTSEEDSNRKISTTSMTSSKQQQPKDTSISSSIFKTQKKNSLSKDKKPPSSFFTNKSTENTMNGKEKLSSMDNSKITLNTTNDTTKNMISSSNSKTTIMNSTTTTTTAAATTTTTSTTTTTTGNTYNFHKVPTKSKTPTSISSSDIALKINFFSNLSKEGKVK